MKITYELMDQCREAAKIMADSGLECVHVLEDGTVSTGTLYASTTPSGQEDGPRVVFTYHPGMADDPLDCFVRR